MLTVDERLKHVTLKVKRANEHISAFEQQVRTFLERRPYKVGAKRDPETRKLIYFVESAEPTPDCLPVIAGDAIQNLMSALDHLAYQIVCSDTGDNPPNPRAIYFPIADDRKKYEANKRNRMNGACQQTFDAFDALKPYKGGNDQLWALHRLNNIDKHRIILTAGSAFRSVDLGAHMSRMLRDSVRAAEKTRKAAGEPSWPYAAADIPIMSAFFRPSDNKCPLKVGDVLFSGAEMDAENDFRFDVALSEAGVIEGKPVLEIINRFAKVVDDTVATLTPLLK